MPSLCVVDTVGGTLCCTFHELVNCMHTLILVGQWYTTVLYSSRCRVDVVFKSVIVAPSAYRCDHLFVCDQRWLHHSVLCIDTVLVAAAVVLHTPFHLHQPMD